MRVMFCLPGRSFHVETLKSFAEVISKASLDPDLEIMAHTRGSADIYAVRNSLVGRRHAGSVEIFGGNDYDVMLWIDADMVYTYDDVKRILSHPEPIVGGICLSSPETIAAGRYGYVADSKVIQYMKRTKLDNYERTDSGLIDVDFTGFAFLAIKRGVFEAMEYPWFRTRIHDHDGTPIQTSEDVGWCSEAKRLGFPIHVDPEVKIGHAKEVVMWP